MNEFEKTRNRKMLERTAKNLERRRYEALVCETREEACAAALARIGGEDTIAFGGSATIAEIGLLDALRNGYAGLIDRDRADAPEEREALMRRGLTADVFLMSANAISEDGILYNIDGNGNRVSAMIYGPKRVLIVAGANKVCHTEAGALARARGYAAPVNAQRFQGLGTPCQADGVCHDCLAERCICTNLVISRRSHVPGRITVILVNENLGF